MNQFVTNHLLDQFVSVFVIAPSIWRPKFSSIDSIEQMAAVRADVGVQMVLFTSTMGAARIVLEMVRKLQQLVGQVSPPPPLPYCSRCSAWQCRWPACGLSILQRACRAGGAGD